MALVPMGNYVFVLSQFQTFGYLLVYFGILAVRYRYLMLRAHLRHWKASELRAFGQSEISDTCLTSGLGRLHRRW